MNRMLKTSLRDVLHLARAATALEGSDRMNYVRGLCDGLGIAQGRAWREMTELVLTVARESGDYYKDIILDLEMILDGN
jgi:hypothetical protein